MLNQQCVLCSVYSVYSIFMYPNISQPPYSFSHERPNSLFTFLFALEAQADLHSSYEPYGLTPLTVAASSAGSDTATVAALLKARCDPNPPSRLADLALTSFQSLSQWIGLRENV